jgi:hypothetical protein
MPSSETIILANNILLLTAVLALIAGLLLLIHLRLGEKKKGEHS